MDERNNLSDINENELFIQYLNDYRVSKKIIKIAEKIDFLGIYNLYDKNFDELWVKINRKKLKEDSLNEKQEFKENILLLIRQSIFNVLYIGIKDLKIKEIDFDELNNGILKDFAKIMKNFFHVFRIEYQLLTHSKKIKKDVFVNSLNKKEDKHNIFPKVEKSNKMVVEIKYNPDDIHIYDKVLKEFGKVENKEENTSLRKIVLNLAEKELGIKNKDELQLFYKRFIRYKRKQKNGKFENNSALEGRQKELR